MPQVSPAAHALARRVVLHEVGESPDPAALVEAAARADTRLRGRLAALIGLTGYTALVARAVRLAQTEVPALERGAGDAADAEETLRGVRAAVETTWATSHDPRAAETVLVVILAHVIGLLITFIGEDLALRLVREAWSDLTPDPAAPEEHV